MLQKIYSSCLQKSQYIATAGYIRLRGFLPVITHLDALTCVILVCTCLLGLLQALQMSIEIGGRPIAIGLNTTQRMHEEAAHQWQHASSA